MPTLTLNRLAPFRVVPDGPPPPRPLPGFASVLYYTAEMVLFLTLVLPPWDVNLLYTPLVAFHSCGLVAMGLSSGVLSHI
jgi:hypothetical protein